MNLQEIEAENKYYKLLTSVNNIMGMLDTVKTYLISNNANIMPLSSILKDLNEYSSKDIEGFSNKYNNLLFTINKVISKLDFARLIYRNDLFVINILTNIINKLSNCANLNYKPLNVEYAPIEQAQTMQQVNIANNSNNKVAPIPEPKPIEIKINNLVKSNKIENVEQVTKEIKKQEIKETESKTEVKPNNKAFSGVYMFENAKNLKSMFYNVDKKQLLMTFKKSNKTYLYNNVDDVVIAELIKHDKENNHATTYFNKEVVKNKNSYPYKLIA